MKEVDNLERYLENVAIEKYIDKDWKGKKVNLMTMTDYKGVEVDSIVYTGWEEELLHPLK